MPFGRRASVRSVTSDVPRQGREWAGVLAVYAAGGFALFHLLPRALLWFGRLEADRECFLRGLFA